MNFTIFYKCSGRGLEVDAALLKNALQSIGHQCDVKKISMERSSWSANAWEFVSKALNLLYLWNSLKKLLKVRSPGVAIHLENPIYKVLYSNQTHILIPNQEWVDPHRMDLLKSFKYIWCKTNLAVDIFSELGLRTRYVGFYSEVQDSYRYSRVEKNSNYFLSRTGMSQYRGAKLLVDTWREHPEWPCLKLVAHPSCQPADKPENVEYIGIFSQRSEFCELAGKSLYHIYLTETEGFGHSIVEALGYGAIVMLNDAPPMNELVDVTCGILVDCRYIGSKRLSPRFGASKASVEEAVERVLAMSEDDAEKMTQSAIARYQYFHSIFPENLKKIIESDFKIYNGLG